MKNNPCLKLGLTMAGAVSAGAYTAGVMDYLMETLERWEQAKKFNRENPDKADPSIPMHDVQICVMGGASAGGMTTGITLSAIREGFRPISFEEYDSKKNDPQAREDFARNKYFDCWVNLTSDEMLPELLENGDIKALHSKNVASLLNSTFINQIANRAFPDDRTDVPEIPPFFHPELEIILTLTNLQGYQIKFPFRGGTENATYISTTHRDFAHFKLMSNGGDPGQGQIPFRYDDPNAAKSVREAAMATGAFPIGLKHREFTRKGKYILNNPLINPTLVLDNIPLDKKADLFVIPQTAPKTPAATPTDDALESLKRRMPSPWEGQAILEEDCKMIFVDGGLLNNEPFEVTQTILTEYFDAKTGMDNFDGTIIMIDPFPSEPGDYGIEFEANGVMDIVGKVLKTLRSEPLVKPESLLRSFKKEDYDRFTISPSLTRFHPDNREEYLAGSKAIACGSLDGFGGFISRSFREHDFFLGRRNCQSFLRQYFAVKADINNDIINQGFATQEAKDRFTFTDRVSGEVLLPLIPDLTHQGDNKPRAGLPGYPDFGKQTVKSVRKLLRKRINAITGVMVKSGSPGYIILGCLLWLSKWFLSRKLSKMMGRSLEGHGMVKVKKEKN